jgi:hypothetical protein
MFNSLDLIEPLWFFSRLFLWSGIFLVIVKLMRRPFYPWALVIACASACFLLGIAMRLIADAIVNAA